MPTGRGGGVGPASLFQPGAEASAPPSLSCVLDSACHSRILANTSDGLGAPVPVQDPAYDWPCDGSGPSCPSRAAAPSSRGGNRFWGESLGGLTFRVPGPEILKGSMETQQPPPSQRQDGLCAHSTWQALQGQWLNAVTWNTVMVAGCDKIPPRLELHVWLEDTSGSPHRLSQLSPAPTPWATVGPGDAPVLTSHLGPGPLRPGGQQLASEGSQKAPR